MSAPYIASLDGLRAVSIILVLLSHFGIQFVPGVFGVTIFFFISGYLIASQLLRELDGTGSLGLPNFYLRRALRLYPALLVAVAIGLAVFPPLGVRVTAIDVLSAMFYGANIWEQFGGLESGMPGALHPYSILWSLAVEEHYYLVFPILALLVGRFNRLFLIVACALIAAVGAWRIALVQLCSSGTFACGYSRILHSTDTRVDSILFGAVLAILMDGSLRAWTLRLLQRRASFAAGAVLLVAALAIRDQWVRDTIRFDIQGVGLFLCIGGLLFDPRWRTLARWLSVRPMLVTGRLSYSLYLMHWLVLALFGILAPSAWTRPLFTDPHPPAWWLATIMPLLMLLSFAAAASCYYFVERPMVAVRRRFGSDAVADRASREPKSFEPLPQALQPR